MEQNLPKPDNNLVMAILCTICCCLPLGIVGIIKATKVDSYYNAGQYALAKQSADEAKKYSMIGIVVGGIVSVIYGIISFLGAL